MPIVGFTMPTGHGVSRRVPLDQLELLDRVIPTAVLKSLLSKEVGDERHQGTKLSVTSGLGCPRKLAIQRFLPTWPDPMSMWMAQGGTWIHSEMARLMSGQDGWVTEGDDGSVGCVFHGRVWGYEMSCLLDAYHTNEAGEVDVIRDYKTSFNNSSQWHQPDDRAEPHVEAQLNLQRMLVEQSIPVAKDVQMEGWIISREWRRTLARRLTEVEVGATSVGVTKYHTGKVWTVKELFDQVVHVFRGVEDALASDEGEAGVREAIATLPLVGLNQWNSNPKKGTNGCSICGVKKTCDEISGRF